MSELRVERVDSFSWDDDGGPAADVRRIAESARQADGTDPLDEAARLTLRHRGLADGILLIARHDNDAVGFAWAHELSEPGPTPVELVVEPAARGRGVGTALGREILTLVDVVTAWSHGGSPAADALAARLGLRAARELWVMRRPSPAPLPEAPVPEGYSIRSFRPGSDDAAFLAVNAAAFADHPEQGALDQAGLEQRMSEKWFDADGFLVAERDRELVGFHWTKVHPAEGSAPPHGEVYVIGVHPSTQGSGLGRALLVAGLRHLEEQELGEVVLYVEADNTGAIKLYESFGFTHSAADTHVQYRT